MQGLLRCTNRGILAIFEANAAVFFQSHTCIQGHTHQPFTVVAHHCHYRPGYHGAGGYSYCQGCDEDGH